MFDDSARLRENLERPLPDLMAELALYDETTRGANETWQKIAEPLRQRICTEWKWCKVRQDARFENDYDLLVAVASVLTSRVLHLPLDVDLVLVATILVKRGLDSFCGCA
ncbi:MAG: hypothetical protein KC449_04060 [Anaerolineales bacterium]|nr:hypothetical protein [Anaerolineales bacterium]